MSDFDLYRYVSIVENELSNFLIYVQGQKYHLFLSQATLLSGLTNSDCL